MKWKPWGGVRLKQGQEEAILRALLNEAIEAQAYVLSGDTMFFAIREEGGIRILKLRVLEEAFLEAK